MGVGEGPGQDKDLGATAPQSLSVDDRVARRYDGKVGIVRAIYPDDFVDDTVVEFHDGIVTLSNHAKFQKLSEKGA